MTIKAAILWLALIVFVSISHPAKLPTIALIIPFVLLYFASLYSLKAIVGYRASSRSSKVSHIENKLPVIITTALVVVVAMQSIGQLTARDVATVFLVVILGYFYIHKNDQRQKK